MQSVWIQSAGADWILQELVPLQQHTILLFSATLVLHFRMIPKQRAQKARMHDADQAGG
jgi:hypothetical protein